MNWNLWTSRNRAGNNIVLLPAAMHKILFLTSVLQDAGLRIMRKRKLHYVSMWKSLQRVNSNCYQIRPLRRFTKGYQLLVRFKRSYKCNFVPHFDPHLVEEMEVYFCHILKIGFLVVLYAVIHEGCPKIVSWAVQILLECQGATWVKNYCFETRFLGIKNNVFFCTLCIFELILKYPQYKVESCSSVFQGTGVNL